MLFTLAKNFFFVLANQLSILTRSYMFVGRTGTGLNNGTDSVVRHFTYDVLDKENTREESVENMMHD